MLVAFLSSWDDAFKLSVGSKTLTATRNRLTNILEDFSFAKFSIPTKYVLLTKPVDFDRRKWLLSSSNEALGQVTKLVGYKICSRIVLQKQALGDRGEPNANSDLEKFFKDVRIDGEAVKPKHIERAVRIDKRLSRSVNVANALDIAEHVYESAHPLANLPTLDTLCTRTSCPSIDLLADKLLQFTTEGTVCLQLRGKIDKDVGHKDLLVCIVPGLLLTRRVLVFLHHRFPLPNDRF